ncbi:MAG: hypothetical protein IIT37_10775, partial [Bacteroidales bacterium]|nr:hypothetical protein [Bacteroidales bacterium]
MKKLFFILGVFLTLAVVVSCGDDEEDEPLNNEVVDSNTTKDADTARVVNADTTKVVNVDTTKVVDADTTKIVDADTTKVIDDNPTPKDGIYSYELYQFMKEQTDNTVIYDVNIL